MNEEKKHMFPLFLCFSRWLLSCAQYSNPYDSFNKLLICFSIKRREKLKNTVRNVYPETENAVPKNRESDKKTRLEKLNWTKKTGPTIKQSAQLVNVPVRVHLHGYQVPRLAIVSLILSLCSPAATFHPTFHSLRSTAIAKVRGESWKYHLASQWKLERDRVAKHTEKEVKSRRFSPAIVSMSSSLALLVVQCRQMQAAHARRDSRIKENSFASSRS